ncbi:MAG TPA: LPS assembly protein LptD [Acidobacteriaceae bacterium]
MPKNLRSFLCITVVWLCHPQPALWAWQSGHPESSAVPAQQTQSSSASQSASDSLPNVPDAAELPRLEPVPGPGKALVPVHIAANTQRKDGSVYTLLGDVEIRYKDYVVHADRMNYNEDTGEARAEGHVELDGGPADEHILADHATLNLDLDTGRFYTVTGSVGVRANASRKKVIYTTTNPFLFTGRVVIKNGPQDFHVINGTMTSCRLPHPDWVIAAGRINVTDGQASARNALFRVLNIPVIYLPYFTHPVMSSDRQSGFLIPVFSQSNTKGSVFGEQIYLVLNRSMDLTVGTDFFSKRGWAPSGEFRYRGRGDDFADIRFTALFDRGTLVNGQLTDQGGQDVLINGRHSLGPHTRLVSNAEYLSSIIYREAFAENFSQATATQINSNIYLTHNSNGFSETGSFNRYINYATVSPGITDVVIAHLPSLEASAIEHPLAGTPLYWSADGSADGLNRREPGFETAHEVGRLDAYPSLSAPLHLGGFDIRPDVAIRETFYTKSQAPTFVLDPVTQSYVPVYRSASLNRKDIEAGLELRAPVMERDFAPAWLAHYDRVLRHTIEPAARYQFISGIDNFRNILRFDPTDLASDTNEIEYSVTQHFYLKKLHPKPCGNAPLPHEGYGRVYLPIDYHDCSNTDTSESLTWTLTQKHYFDPNFGGAVFPNRRNVLATTLDLTGISFLAGPRDYSPLISRLELRTNQTLDFGWDVDYDPHAGRINGSNVYVDIRHAGFFGSISHARLDALNPSTLPTPTMPSPVTNYEQIRATLGYGAGTKQGFSGGLNLGYDLNLSQLQYGGVQTSYNWNCCGLTIEYRRLALGAERNENYESFNFTLAGLGTAGNINRSQLIY